MQTFEYKARALDGSTVTGILSAPDEAVLDAELEDRGLYLTKARPAGSRAGSGGKLSQRELVTLTTQLSTLLSAGVPILDGLRGLSPRMRTEAGRRVVDELADRIQGGASLSDTLEAHPRSFGPVFRASVQAGEMSGALPRVLSSQAAFLEWSASIRQTTMQALTYPLMLCSAILGLVVVMLTFVLPRIVGMMPGGQEALPGPTRFLMQVSDLLTGNWLLLLSALVAAVTGAMVALRREPVAVSVRRAPCASRAWASCSACWRSAASRARPASCRTPAATC